MAALDGQCVVELPDGRKNLVDQTLFDRVDPDSVLPVFPLADDAWSLINPRWHLPGHPAVFPSLMRGTKLSFNILAYDSNNDALVGQVSGHGTTHDAVAPRSGLPWPASFAETDLSLVVGRSVGLTVADPLDRHAVLAGHVNPLPTGMSLARLYSLRTLAALEPNIKVRIVASDAQHLTINLFGWHCQVFPEDRGWRSARVLLTGQLIDARLSVDMASADVFLCMRSPYDPEWSEVQQRYPVGATIERARLISATHRGLVLEIRDQDLTVFGLLPVHQWGPRAPWGHDGYETPPLPLQVVGHMKDRCILLLGLEPYVSARWERAMPKVGARLPLHHSKWSGLSGLCLWDLGCSAACESDVNTDGCTWGIVAESDAERRRVVVEAEDKVRRGRIAATESEGGAVIFDDGSRAELMRDLPPSLNGTDVDTTIVAVHFGPNGAVPVVDAMDEPTIQLWDLLERKFETQEPIEVRITGRVRAGFSASVHAGDVSHKMRYGVTSGAAINAFLPQSHADADAIISKEGLIGETVKVRIIRLDRHKRSCIVSQKALLAEKVSEEIRKFRVGDIVSGSVKKIVDYGAFVTVGTVDGLIHQTDISYRPVSGHSAIEQVLREGDEVTVKVLASDPDKQRLSLGLKQLLPDPWGVAQSTYPVGSCVCGNITNIVDYGVFVELEPGIEGLLHVSKLTWGRAVHPSKIFVKGNSLEVSIEDADIEKRRVSLVSRALLRSPWIAFREEYSPGTHVSGRVLRVDDGVASVALSPGVHGFLSARAYSEETSALRVGDNVRVAVEHVDIDAERASITFVRRLSSTGGSSKLEPGMVLDGRVLGRDLYDVFIVLDGSNRLGRVARVRLGPLFAGQNDLPDGTRVVVELLPWSVGESDLRLALRGLGTAGLDGANSALEVGKPEGARRVLPSNGFIDPVMTRAGEVVSIQMLSSRHAIARSTVAALFKEVCEGDVPDWDQPLDSECARRLVDSLTAFQVPGRPTLVGTEPNAFAVPKPLALAQPTKNEELLRSRSGLVASLQVLSARYGVTRADIVSLFRRLMGCEPPNWSQPLDLADASRMVATLTDTVQSLGRDGGDSLRGVVSPPITEPEAARELPLAVGGSAEQNEASWSSTGPGALPPPLELAPAAERPLSSSCACNKGGSTAPEYFVLRELLRSQGAERPYEDDEGSAGDSNRSDMGGGAALRANVDDSDLLEQWNAWLHNGEDSDAVCALLIDSGFSAVAGLLKPHIAPGVIPAQEGALTELARVSRALTRNGGQIGSAETVDAILRCLVAVPNDVLPWCLLGRAVAQNWLVEHADDVEGWMREHANTPVDMPSMGRCIAVARAATDLGDLKLAHRTLGEWLRHADSIDLRRERTVLGERYRQDILARRRFFDRWTRRVDRDVGRGSFALVLPVTDGGAGEQHALKHLLLLDALGNDLRAGEALFDREARLLQDLLGVDGIPRFIARPSPEALVCAWIDGRTLADLLRDRGALATWTPTDVARLGHRLATVLADVDLRLKGFVHNDLAPRNLILPDDRPETAVLIDLGLAAHSEHSVLTIVDALDLDLRVTYQAPEVREGSPGTVLSDMYSLGLVLLEVWLSGEALPGSPSDVQAALHRLLARGSGGVSRRLGQVLKTLLQQSPDRRPSTWLAVATDFSEIFDA
ncbi:MAG: S1 RNA-binding domain-containing protein [Chromatiaceae bacterium]